MGCRRSTCSTWGQWPGHSASPVEANSSTPPCRADIACWPACRGCAGAVIERLVDHFGGLQKLLAASIDDLQAVDGVGESRAAACGGLSRLAESSILERYV